MNNTLVIGLTGGIGSGKSAAMAAFQSLGVPCIDADQVAREVVEPGSAALTSIAEHFGADAILPDGGLHRAYLRQRVFADPIEKVWLEALLHPLINRRIRDWLTQCNAPYCILSSPLLLETRQHELVNRILLIDVPEHLQISRTMGRDSNSEDQVRAIMAAQSPRTFKRSKADDIILNDQDLTHLSDEVSKLHRQYKQLAREYKAQT
ncbi:dephospho-CoA kinase [Hahella sp. CCB-MM4]|uniref:dephospho-CoA kinase n=1 Tax=Hahella sp. (strain CCB-MM4) TaxID=1926491 RepID=UPI000B9AA4BE|nr:dephospho-CoA kinase [Hahella sp. CCB-MM4]OZG70510.1 dephospho-CoA kinase [Hahella sp. CCB-MM4]